jgi:UPF0755 protein
LSFAVIVLAAALIGRDLHEQLWQPLPLQESVAVEVVKGANFRGVLEDWQGRGYLSSTRQRWALSIYARLSGQDQAMKAGEYRLDPGLRAIDLPALLVSGKVILHELTLVEGWRFEQALQAVRENPVLGHTLPDDSAGAAMAALGRPELHPEGRFYPDTYRFPRGTTDIAFLQRAFSRMEEVLAAEWLARAEGLPYQTAEEALIMASIVERETSLPAERFDIAGVFVRRLQKGMRLQTDPTVIYGMGAAFKGNIRRRDLETDTPYNTYIRKGLPPTPICLPGRASINAALHPAPGGALYFVAKGDGSHYFSATFAEHNAAVSKYQLKRRSR